MVRLAVAVVLSAVLQFAWGFTFWSFSPMSKEMIRPIPDEAKVTQALKEANPETGVYFLPYGDCQSMSDDKEAMEAFAQRCKAGPMVQVVYHKDGIEPMSPVIFGMGFAHMAVGSLLAGVLLTLAAPGLQTYFSRVFFVTLLGVFAVVAMNFAQPIWFHHPWKFHLLHSVYDLGCWLLSGIVLAAFIRRAD